LATITQGTGITVTNGAGTITIASTVTSGVSTITGNSGGALSGSNINIQTSNSTITFAGSGTTETLNFNSSTNQVFGNALASLSGGTDNIGHGASALNATTSGSRNIAIGTSALTASSTSSDNVAVGYQALTAVTTATGANVAVGRGAGNTFTTGNGNTFLGHFAGSSYSTSDSNNISIGTRGLGETPGQSNALRIGGGTGSTNGLLNKTFISGIQTITVTGTAVLVSSSDQLGIAVSSQKFKLDVQDMGAGTDFIYKLRPVTFIWDKTANEGLHDAPDTRQFGLIAEEVAKVQPELAGYDQEGAPLNVHYDRLVPMLLNEIQRLEKRISALESR
jgi:hypothetical protein